MHTDTTPKEMPSRDGNHTAGHTRDSTVPNLVDTDQVFHTFRAAYAFHGHALHRTDPRCGTVTYWAERCGMVRYLPTIDTARQFLEQKGGRL